jgi:hemolysin III
MGWLVVAVSGPVREALPPAGFAWLIAGGLAYSVGAVIFATDRPHLWPGRFSAHDLWHVFVMAGSACHAILVLSYIAPT